MQTVYDLNGDQTREWKNALGYCFISVLFVTVTPFLVSPPLSTNATHCCLFSVEAPEQCSFTTASRQRHILKPASMPGKWSHYSCWQANCSSHASPYHCHLCLQKEKYPHLILCCTTSSQKMGKRNADIRNLLGFLGLLIQIAFPLSPPPSVAINGYGIFTDISSSRQAAYTTK